MKDEKPEVAQKRSAIPVGDAIDLTTGVPRSYEELFPREYATPGGTLHNARVKHLDTCAVCSAGNTCDVGERLGLMRIDERVRQVWLEEHGMVDVAAAAIARENDDRAQARFARDVYTPQGVSFVDVVSGRTMIYVTQKEPQGHLRGWLCWKHPDGQWVTLRKATDDDRVRIAVALNGGHRSIGYGGNEFDALERTERFFQVPMLQVHLDRECAPFSPLVRTAAAGCAQQLNGLRVKLMQEAPDPAVMRVFSDAVRMADRIVSGEVRSAHPVPRAEPGVEGGR